jgi:F-box and WD-40 domain protein 1/11
LVSLSTFPYVLALMFLPDILSLLPPELALYVLKLLCDGSPSSVPIGFHDDPLQTLITCRLVSKTWLSLCNDNAVWRAFFDWKWGSIEERTLSQYMSRQRNIYIQKRLAYLSVHRPRLTSRYQDESMYHFARRSVVGDPINDFRRSRRYVCSGKRSSISALLIPYASFDPSAQVDRHSSLLPATVKWEALFRERLRLHRRWNGTTREMVSRPLSAQISPLLVSASSQRWEPETTRLTGHTDRLDGVLVKRLIDLTRFTQSVYCLELTRNHIVTGSRDNTVKMWSLRTGHCLGTFGKNTSAPGIEGLRGHDGSVLCLKFLWFGKESSELERATHAHGLLFSGSSDRTAFVWELNEVNRTLRRQHSGTSRSGASLHPGDAGEKEVEGRVKMILRGHNGGVLDLRVDDRWIVSW